MVNLQHPQSEKIQTPLNLQWSLRPFRFLNGLYTPFCPPSSGDRNLFMGRLPSKLALVSVTWAMQVCPFFIFQTS